MGTCHFLFIMKSVIIGCLYFFISTVKSDQSAWGGECAGDRQSPIDIKTNSVQNSAVDPYSAADVFSSAEFQGAKTVSMNDVNDAGAHSIKFSFAVEIAVADLKCPQFHFHFQSEHAINSNLYFGEYHVVCYKNSYSDLTDAATSGDGEALRVFGIMVEKDSQAVDNADIAAIITAKESGNTTPMGHDITIPIPDDIEKSRYFTYEGSLTTPGCMEVVQWTVFKKSIKISDSQAAKIALWSAESPALIENNREVQDLNNRKVCAFENSCDGAERQICTNAKSILQIACDIDTGVCEIAHGLFNEMTKDLNCKCSGASALFASFLMIGILLFK